MLMQSALTRVTAGCLNVLLIAPDVDIQRTRQLLDGHEAPGCALISVNTIEDGVDALRASDIDVVLLSLALPDALAHCRNISMQPLSPAIIALAGADDEALVEQAMSAGAQEVLPIERCTTNEVARTLRDAIRLHDLTVRLLEQTQLAARSERRLIATIEQSLDGLVLIDEHGMIRYANPAAATLYHRPAEMLIGRPFEHPLQPNSTIETSIPAPNEESVWIEMHVTSIEWGGDNYYLADMRDITARKRTEQKLEHMVQRLDKAFRGTVDALATASERRDPYTAGHQRQVSRISDAIAVELGLDESAVTRIGIAGLLHDLGKIAVPVEILFRPGRLTDAEFSIIRTHPDVGYDILSGIEFPWPIADIVREHHCRINGTGYPHAQAVTPISLEARIIGVADVVEAMSSHRPYRAALGLDVALAEIQTHSGVLYDPDVTAACVRLAATRREIFT